MKFIKITNYDTSVNRLHLEKLGLSTKRDDEETIGQFGSGIKYAPIAALRKGLRWCFAGSDDKGNYLMEYIVKDDEGIPSIFYKYEDYEKISSFTPDAGILTWEEPFQILREVIANAIDQSKMNGNVWDLSIVDESDVVSTNNQFDVFISADESLMNIIGNFDKYFSVNREPVYVRNGTYSGFSLYPKIENDNQLRIYSKGVLVFCTENIADLFGSSLGLFDYEFPSIELNEERTVRSQYDAHHRIVSALMSIDDEAIAEDVLNKMFSSAGEGYYEFDCIPRTMYSRIRDKNDAWINAFERKFPNSVIISKDKVTYNLMVAARSRGYELFSVDNENKFHLLQTLSIKTSEEILGEQFLYEYTTELNSYPELLKAIKIATHVIPELSLAYPSHIGVITQDTEDCLGMTINMGKPTDDRMILVSDSHAQDSIENIIGTLVHEFDHFYHGLIDGDHNGRAFRDLADRQISKLVIRQYKIEHGLDENDLL